MIMRGSKSIILASSSPRRQELIAILGLPFTVIPSEADESTPLDWTPQRTVEELAARKARHVYESLSTGQDAIIVGSDTVVVLDDVILGKPKNQDEAFSMIMSLQGRDHEVYTGIACFDIGSGHMKISSRMTRVTMKSLSKSEGLAYVRSGEGLDKAGAYGIQGLGATLIHSIQGDYFNVVGLPLSLLADMLGEFGLQVLQ